MTMSIGRHPHPVFWPFSVLPEESARWLCDWHLRHAAGDSCKVAASVIEMQGPKGCSVVPPCSSAWALDPIGQWAVASKRNYRWLIRYARACVEEFVYRFGRYEEWSEWSQVVGGLEKTVGIVTDYITGNEVFYPLSVPSIRMSRCPRHLDPHEAYRDTYLAWVYQQRGRGMVMELGKERRTTTRQPPTWTRRQPPRWLKELAPTAIRFEPLKQYRGMF